MSTPEGDVTRLLHEWSNGRADALDQLFPLIYVELRRIAARYLRKERSGHTLQTTALVHEAYLRLVGQDRAGWRDRSHFFAIAAQAMRRILVDHARRNLAEKRIGPQRRISLEEAPEIGREPCADLLIIDEALSRLAAVDQAQARVVELRFFGGLTVEETATALGVSESTVAREWRMARVWLRREMERNER